MLISHTVPVVACHLSSLLSYLSPVPGFVYRRYAHVLIHNLSILYRACSRSVSGFALKRQAYSQFSGHSRIVQSKLSLSVYCTVFVDPCPPSVGRNRIGFRVETVSPIKVLSCPHASCANRARPITFTARTWATEERCIIVSTLQGSEHDRLCPALLLRLHQYVGPIRPREWRCASSIGTLCIASISWTSVSLAKADHEPAHLPYGFFVCISALRRPRCVTV